MRISEEPTTEFPHCTRYFRNLKYLEAVAGPIKLLAGPTKLTVRRSFDHMFVGDQHAFEES
jgi:hypothetical protein